jgi:hypothetical protein
VPAELGRWEFSRFYPAQPARHLVSAILPLPRGDLAAFDDSNLLAHGGLAAAVRLAERCGLPGLVREKVHLAGAGNGAGAAPDAKAVSLVAGMLAGADSIDDVDVLRHGAMAKAYRGVRAPSTVGSFLRAFTRGHVRQLEPLGRSPATRPGTATCCRAVTRWSTWTSTPR